MCLFAQELPYMAGLVSVILQSAVVLNAVAPFQNIGSIQVGQISEFYNSIGAMLRSLSRSA